MEAIKKLNNKLSSVTKMNRSKRPSPKLTKFFKTLSFQEQVLILNKKIKILQTLVMFWGK